MTFDEPDVDLIRFCFETKCFFFVCFPNFLVVFISTSLLGVLVDADTSCVFPFESVIAGDDTNFVSLLCVLILRLLTLTMLEIVFSMLLVLELISIRLCVDDFKRSLVCRWRKEGITISGFGQDLDGHPLEKCL